MIVGGSAADVIVGGGGTDIITGGGGADKITVSGGHNLLMYTNNSDTGVNTTTTSAISELTGTFDVITGLTSTDLFNLTGSLGVNPSTAVTNTNLAGLAGKVAFATGTYDGVAGTFSYSAAGLDSTMTWDIGSGVFETVVLVGYVSAAPSMNTTVTGLVGIA